MGSEKGRELKTGLACATFWVERLLWPLPHLYAVLSYLARYCLCHDYGRSGWVRAELWEWLVLESSRAAHSCSWGNDPELSPLSRNVLSRNRTLEKEIKSKLQCEPSLVCIGRKSHVNTSNMHAYHIHTEISLFSVNCLKQFLQPW